MAGVIDSLTKMNEAFSTELNLVFILAFFTIVIVLYSIFVFYFYRFLAKKNIIELNLSQYNKYEHAFAVKFFAVVLYIIEYIILLPIVTFFWFAVLAILILVLAEGISLNTILVISAALVTSVRITSYINQTLSKDLAKMLPFTLLAVAITKPGFFEVQSLLYRFTEIPSLFSNILYFLIFIVVIELMMRFAELLTSKKEEGI